MFVFGVIAGKGGVGKSSLTVLLAYAFQKLGLKIGILDADIYGPSIRQMLPNGIPPEAKEDGGLVPAKLAKIEVISLAFFQQFDASAIFRAPIANGVIQQFIHRVHWSELDILLVDFPPGTGDIQLTLMQEAKINGAILLTTPGEVSLIDVRKSCDMALNMGVPILGVVENMSYYEDPLTKEKIHIFGKGGGERLAKEINRPFLKQIPVDSLICQNLDQGKELFGSSYTSAALDAVWELSIELSNQICDYSSRKQAVNLKEITLTTCEINFEGREIHLRYSDIQKKCTCARCFDSQHNIQVIDPDRIDPELQMKSYRVVGNYGIQFTFSSGCSQGIYELSELIGS